MSEASDKTWTSPHGRKLPEVGGRTLVMGILNATPDSFSDGGLAFSPDDALRHAARLIAEGADVLDIGGESTRPGHEVVGVEEETRRVVSVIRAIRREFPDIPVSVDTAKAEVAEAAVEAGADLVNDVWGLRHQATPELWENWNAAVRANRDFSGLPSTPMAQTVARLRCPVILMHNRPAPVYGNFWSDVLTDLRAGIALAAAAGIEGRQLWTDPGFGFAKNVPQNLEVLKNLHRIVHLGPPVLLGTSRKSTIGKVLARPVDRRLEGTAATQVWGIAEGAAMVRVHDVGELMPFLKMTDAVRQGLDHA